MEVFMIADKRAAGWGSPHLNFAQRNLSFNNQFDSLILIAHFQRDTDVRSITMPTLEGS